jgi:anti-sigma-K factor RskA
MMDNEEIDGLAAEYVLGSLDPFERKEVEVRRKVDVTLDDAIIAWEKRLAPLSDLLPGTTPPPHVLFEVTKQLGHQRDQQKMPWRWPALAAGACALAACLAIIPVWLSPKSSASPVRLVAELERSTNPADGIYPTAPLGFVVIFDLRDSTMIVSPLAVPPGSRRDYQLWLVPEGSAPPISLGVIPLAEPSVSPWLATYAPNDLVHARLAVSLEPPGGSPIGIPTGPTIFAGTLVRTIP